MFRSVHLLPVLGTLLLSGCYSEMFVVFPQWDVQLTNWSGAVVADTPLYAYAWLDPHSRLDAGLSTGATRQGTFQPPNGLAAK
ncbi:MAG: hypothetical protein AVDCRST_MAG86-2897 [uncultured Truepera sp.]|uniref:Uncharacterized protein n=1 Tax=uncultured Truepera sp. TaxID=543023 RepID=A0A6J4VFH5_9DEIN|nr:MAG: hypothetical protein AVDCRST_MAG86-2897 [uncultured Truepera sp.]